MKLDPTVMRTMNANDFRVMEAVEKGMKDHALVPLPLLSSIANLRHGGTHKIVSSLLRDKLLSHECKRRNSVDGYRLTNAGYDILALHNLKKRGFVAALGQRIGTGKESDIYLAVTPSGQQVVLKFHRLGRTSFRNVRKKRDYFGNRAMTQAHSWLFLSRLSALKEYAFMKALYDVKYPTPTPVAHNRHVVAMSLVRGMPLYQIYPKQLSVEQAADIYEQAIRLAVRLAKHGLVHCDLNEFNLLVDLSGIQAMAVTGEDPYVRHSGQSVAGTASIGALSKPAWEQSLEEGDNIQEALPEPIARLENGEPKPVVTLIDFPQMISTQHPNGQELYERDLACLQRFFEMKLHCRIPDDALDIDPSWEAVVSADDETKTSMDKLDSELRASGYSDSLNQDLELYYFQTGPRPIDSAVAEEDEESEEDAQESDDLSEDEDSDEVNQDSEDEADAKEREVFDDEDNQIDKDGLEEEEREAQSSVVVEPEMMLKLDRARLEEEAKAAVRRQIDNDRRKARGRGAFRKRNNNKNYVKGKRVLSDSIF